MADNLLRIQLHRQRPFEPLLRNHHSLRLRRKADSSINLYHSLRTLHHNPHRPIRLAQPLNHHLVLPAYHSLCLLLYGGFKLVMVLADCELELGQGFDWERRPCRGQNQGVDGQLVGRGGQLMFLRWVFHLHYNNSLQKIVKISRLSILGLYLQLQSGIQHHTSLHQSLFPKKYIEQTISTIVSNSIPINSPLILRFGGTQPYKCPIKYFSLIRLALSLWMTLSKSLVPSRPATSTSLLPPPGCSSRNGVQSYTFPQKVIQQSFSVLCLATSSLVNTFPCCCCPAPFFTASTFPPSISFLLCSSLCLLTSRYSSLILLTRSSCPCGISLLSITPSTLESLMLTAQGVCICWLKGWVPSRPEYFRRISSPPGCSARNVLTLQIRPSMRIQQSRLFVCFEYYSHVITFYMMHYTAEGYRGNIQAGQKSFVEPWLHQQIEGAGSACRVSLQAFLNNPPNFQILDLGVIHPIILKLQQPVNLTLLRNTYLLSFCGTTICPVAISQITTPTPHTSTFSPYSSPATTSGAIYSTVPKHSLPSQRRQYEKPKSHSFTSSQFSLRHRMFSGLMSRCTMWWEWRQATAESSWRVMDFSWVQVGGCFWSWRDRLSPITSYINRWMQCQSEKEWYRGIRFQCRIQSWTFIQLRMLSGCLRAVDFGMLFWASHRPSLGQYTRYTDPNAPTAIVVTFISPYQMLTFYGVAGTAGFYGFMKGVVVGEPFSAMRSYRSLRKPSSGEQLLLKPVVEDGF